MGNLCGCPRAERLRKAIDAAVDSLETTPDDTFPFEAMDILTEAQDERDPREKQFDELFVAMRLFVKDPPPQNPLARKRWNYGVPELSKRDRVYWVSGVIAKRPLF